MIRRHSLAVLLIAALPLAATPTFAASANLDSLVARHAAANNLPEELVRRVIKRESRGNPRVISLGNYGLMQIRLGTARAMGYRGSAAGLLDADTNMTYAVKYLAGAYHAAGGNQDRAVHYYAAGYYYVAKNKGLLKDTSPDALNAFASSAAGDAASLPKSNPHGGGAPAGPLPIVDRFTYQ